MQLRLMTPAEFAVRRRQLIDEYAASQMRVGGWSSQEAAASGERATDGLLPKGLDTPGMFLFVAEDEQGLVGTLWLSLTNQRGLKDTAWIYAIEVVFERRGQGLGRALLAAAEKEAGNRGVVTLGLNVFADNETAVNLYRTAGYDTITQQMRKSLS
jgi:GNAT superfamily N-acetyltransferase